MSAAVALSVALVGSAAVGAPPAGKKIVVGLLDGGERSEGWNAFRERMRELGYNDGGNVRFEQRIAQGKPELLPAMANELVQLRAAVIVTSSSSAAIAAEGATRNIPIVMATGGDQVSRGLASSLARPGGNVTGLASFSSDLMGKRLELLREIVPKSVRVAALWHANNPSTTSMKELETSVTKAGVAFHSVRVYNAAELPNAFASMARERIDGVVVINGPLLFVERARVAELAKKHKLPAMYGAAEYADAGGLLSYGPSYPQLFRHAADYVDKILNGANPAQLPIEQATRFELVINASTARALGIAIPAALRARVDRVIE